MRKNPNTVGIPTFASAKSGFARKISQVDKSTILLTFIQADMGHVTISCSKETATFLTFEQRHFSFAVHHSVSFKSIASFEVQRAFLTAVSGGSCVQVLMFTMITGLLEGLWTERAFERTFSYRLKQMR